MRNALRRRDFLQLGCASIACAQLGAIRAAAQTLSSARRRVSVRAQIGNVFPPLDLVRRMREPNGPSAEILVGNSGSHESAGEQRPQSIHVGIRVPDIQFGRRGILTKRTQEVIMRRIRSHLEDKLQCEIVQTTLEPGPAFSYPYLASHAGSLTFCRLTLKDYLA
jgi:hypothetical protein